MKALEVIVAILFLKYSVNRYLFLFIPLKVFIFQQSAIYLHSAKFVANPTYVADTHFVVFNDTEGISTWNLTTTTKVELKGLLLAYAIMGKVKETNEEFDRTFLRGNIDTCDINKGMIGVFMQTVFLELMLKHSNYHFGCPVNKGPYYANNVPAFNDKLLPTYILNLYGDFMLTIGFKGKIGNAKGFTQLGTVKVMFTIVR